MSNIIYLYGKFFCKVSTVPIVGLRLTKHGLTGHMVSRPSHPRTPLTTFSVGQNWSVKQKQSVLPPFDSVFKAVHVAVDLPEFLIPYSVPYLILNLPGHRLLIIYDFNLVL